MCAIQGLAQIQKLLWLVTILTGLTLFRGARRLHVLCVDDLVPTTGVKPGQMFLDPPCRCPLDVRHSLARAPTSGT